MVNLNTWLPLTGRLIQRIPGITLDGISIEHGIGDVANPVSIISLVDLYLKDGNALTEDVTIRAIEYDWDNKQVLVSIEGSQEFIDWLNTRLGIIESSDQLSDGSRLSIHTVLETTEMEDSSKI